MPDGWEDTLPGVGRPQSLINRDIEKCDFFVLVLWDRWGSQPDTPERSEYSSGCEEEFDLALKCLEDPGRPMQQVVIFFKGVDPRQLADPGRQLTKVLKFKRRIESGKEQFFDTFDEIALFQKRLRLLLAAWLQDHEKGLGPKGHSSEGDESD